MIELLKRRGADVPSMLLAAAAVLSPLVFYSGVYEPLWFFKEKFITLTMLLLLPALFIFYRKKITIASGSMTAYSVYILPLLVSFFFSRHKSADQLVFQSACLLVLALYDRGPSARRLRDALVFFTSLLCAVAVSEKAGLDIFGWNGGFTGIFSTMGNPNYMAALLAAVLPLPAYEFLCAASPRRRAFYFISSMIILAGVILTFTRSAWAASLLSLGVMAVCERKRLPGRLHFLAVTAAAVAAVALLLPQVKGSALSALDFRSPSLVQRYLMWKVSMDMAIDNPAAGVGSGNYSKYYLEYQSPYTADPSMLKYINDTDNAHNLFLHTFAEQGMPGLAALIYLLVFWLKNSGPRVKYHAVSILTVSLFTSVFYIAPVFLAVAILMSGEDGKGKLLPLTGGARFVPAVLAALLLLCGLSSLASNLYLENGLKNANAGDYEAARGAFQASARLNRGLAEPLYFGGILEGNAGNYPAAIISLEKSLKMGYIHNDAFFHLGRLYGITGRGPAEKKLYRKARSLNPFVVINN